MKKNFLISMSVAAIIALAIGACNDDFLNTPPQAALSGSILSSSKNGVDATLIGAYKSLIGWTSNWNEAAWGTAPSNWAFNTASDDAHKGSEPGDLDEILSFELFQWNPANGIIRSKWIATYEGIVRSNAAITTATDFLKAAPDQTDYVNRIKGEATFLRGFFHFEAYKMWGKIPYYTEADKEFTKKNDVDVLPLIIKDFEAAAGLLPAVRSQVGRADKAVATAYLGKAKLYNKDYAGAKAAFDAVIATGRFGLVDCFYDNFSVAGDNNKESIFAVQTSVNDGAGDGDNSNFGERLAEPHGDSFTGCCGFKNPTYDLAFAYKTDANGLPIPVSGALARIKAGDATLLDPRIDWTMGRTDVPFLDWGPQKDSWIRGQGYAGWYSPKKNLAKISDGNLSGSWAGAQLTNLNVELMRYSDLLLMAAETEVEVGSLAKAAEYVNAIRTRAGNCAQGKSKVATSISDPEITWAKYKVAAYPAGSAAFASKEAARETVRLERRLELALEGHRLFDLQRWGNYAATVNAYLAREKALVTVLNSGGQASDKHRFYPLPSSEIERSNGNLTQNAGY